MKTCLFLLVLLTFATPALAFTASPNGTTPTITYTEPTTVVGGVPTPITDLSSTRIYWKIDTGTETMVTVPASKPTGGGVIVNSSILLPILACQKGTVNVAVTAVNGGGESARAVATPLVVDRTKEASCVPAAPTNFTVQ